MTSSSCKPSWIEAEIFHSLGLHFSGALGHLCSLSSREMLVCKKRILIYGNIYTKAALEVVLETEVVKESGILGLSTGYQSLPGSGEIPAQQELPLCLHGTGDVSLQGQLCSHPINKRQSCPKENSHCCHSLREQRNPSPAFSNLWLMQHQPQPARKSTTGEFAPVQWGLTEISGISKGFSSPKTTGRASGHPESVLGGNM